jgi:hypothetical protein
MKIGIQNLFYVLDTGFRRYGKCSSDVFDFLPAYRMSIAKSGKIWCLIFPWYSMFVTWNLEFVSYFEFRISPRFPLSYAASRILIGTDSGLLESKSEFDKRTAGRRPLGTDPPPP